MDDVQEAAAVQALLEALPDDATAEQVLQATRNYRASSVAIALMRIQEAGGGGAAVPDPATGTDGQIPIVADDEYVLGPPGWSIGPGGELILEGSGDADTFIIRAADGQTDAVLFIEDAGGNEILRVHPGGGVEVTEMAGSNPVFQAASGVGGERVAVFTGAAGHTVMVSENGYLIVTATAAPADGELGLDAGTAALWFDQTNGAAKLMIKAKQADGTVRTGAVNLT